MTEIKPLKRLCLAALAAYLVLPSSASAEEVVRFNLESDSIPYTADVSLLDELAPLTVANFLNYVIDGRYSNSFFHRSEPGFVLQGGGFTFDANLNTGLFSYDFSGGLQEIPTDPPVVNEFKVSNSRGTIAMAKLGNDPDSATDQWFVNMDFNSLTLDPQNGGFTVFGKVLANGMDVFDLFAIVPVYNVTNVNSAFTSMPLNNGDLIDFVENINDSNLILLRSIDRLYHIDTRVDFGVPADGVAVQRNVTITNYNYAPITIDPIDTSAIAGVFSIDTSACSGQTLAVSQTCTMSATLNPGALPYYSTNFNVVVSNPGHNFIVNLTTPAPNIAPSITPLDFGEQQQYDPLTSTRTDQLVLFINNIGDRDLDISSVVVTGDSEAFPFVDNCTTVSPLAPGEYCILPVNFAAQQLGVMNANMVITSNDPDTPDLVIPMTGVSNADVDGVSAAIEDLAPNNGDGNNDGIRDSAQSQVFSIPDMINRYVTVIADSPYILDTVSFTSLFDYPLQPDNTSLDGGILTFRLSKISKGHVASIGLILPVEAKIVNVYSFGPTLDNTVPHWYSVPDAIELFNNSDILSPDGLSSIKRNLAKLSITDGGDGDSDLLANGEITLSIAIDTRPAGNGSSTGALHQYLLILLYLVLLVRRSVCRSHRQD